MEKGNFAVGQYFLSKEKEQREKGMNLIESEFENYGLEVVAWRNVDESLDLSAVSAKSIEKKPALRQAIVVPNEKISNLEEKVLKVAANIINKRGNLELDISSQSSESIVYKGMVKPSQIGVLFKDLQDPDFTAVGTIMHSRFATNTSPQWKNAQPCTFFIAQNGELNSRKSNAREMKATEGTIEPDLSLSDSIQLDTDLVNEVLRGSSLPEALTLLSPPIMEENDQTFSEELKSMIKYFSLKRTGYNGPAFIVSAHNGEYFAKLDNVGLRPSRYYITESNEGRRQFYAFSDDDAPLGKGQKRILSGHIEPGSIIGVNKNYQFMSNIDILENVYKESLQKVKELYGDQQLTFQSVYEKLVIDIDSIEEKTFNLKNDTDLTPTQVLASSFWDYESLEDIVKPMALSGGERVGAMGNDTSLLPALSGKFEEVGQPLHISYFFHHLFSQVSSPPIDSIKEKKSFNLSTLLGSKTHGKKNFSISSPVLNIADLDKIKSNTLGIEFEELDLTFPVWGNSKQNLKQKIHSLCRSAEAFAKSKGGILILSDRKTSSGKILLLQLKNTWKALDLAKMYQ